MSYGGALDFNESPTTGQDVSTPSYSSVYGSTRSAGPASPTPSPVVSSNFTLPSDISSDNISSLSGLQNFFDNVDSSQNYSSVYSNVGSGLETQAEAAQQDITNPAVSQTAFGFANSLFEGQQTPSTVAQVESENASNPNFNSQTLSFLQPVVDTSGEAQIIGSELGGGSSPLPNGGIGAAGTSAPSGAGPQGNYITPPDPATQQTQQQSSQQQQQQPQQQQSSGGLLGGNGASSSSLGATASGLLAGLEAWVSAHPVATVAILVGAFLIFSGSLSQKSGGRKR